MLFRSDRTRVELELAPSVAAPAALIAVGDYDLALAPRMPEVSTSATLPIPGNGFVWGMLNAVNKMGKVDPVTGNIEEFDIPVPNSFPRKAGFDANGDVWVGLHGAGKLMKIDHTNNKFTIFQPPTENSGVYAASVDQKSGLVWIAQQHVDKIGRFDPKTEKFTEFPLANAEEDHRRLEVDQKNPKRIWWSGNLSSKVGYIELLD